MNKAIKHYLKTKLKNLKMRWADNLPEVLWAYKTTARSMTGETLFSPAYKYEAMDPVELGVGSLRKDNFDPEQNMILQRHKLDFLEEKQHDSQLQVAAYPRRTARYFNSKVKMRGFQVKDLFLIRVLHNKGELNPSWEGPYKIIGVLTPGAYQLTHLTGDQIPRSWNANYLKNVLSMIVCTFVNKVRNLKIKSSKTHAMTYQ